MTESSLTPGCILHWDKFKLSDGTDGHKYFVVVGAQQGQNFLLIRATSQKKHNRTTDAGGNAKAGWYHIPGNGKDWFKKDTWLLFHEPEEFSAAELLSASLKGEIQIKGNLRHDIANAICNSMRKCNDVSEYHRGLLGPPALPPKKP